MFVDRTIFTLGLKRSKPSIVSFNKSYFGGEQQSVGCGVGRMEKKQLRREPGQGHVVGKREHLRWLWKKPGYRRDLTPSSEVRAVTEGGTARTTSGKWA